MKFSVTANFLVLLLLHVANSSAAVISGRVSLPAIAKKVPSAEYSRGIYHPQLNSPEERLETRQKKLPKVIIWAEPVGRQAVFRKLGKKLKLFRKTSNFTPTCWRCKRVPR